VPFCHEHNNGRSLRTIFARHGEPHGSSALLIWRIGSLASPILPDHGTFFADGQAIKGLSVRWFQA
jgi:hypothetical protein